MNAKILVFVIRAVATIYLLLYNLGYCNFKWRLSIQWIYTAQIILSGWFFVHLVGKSNVQIHLIFY